jgi:hypothetical protein
MTIREATSADDAILPAEWPEEGRVLVAEVDGHPAMALHEAAGRVSLAYLRPEGRRRGLEEALLRELADRIRDVGPHLLTVTVAVGEEDAAAALRRLGFVERRRELEADVSALAGTADRPTGNSYGSVHVQTDDQNGVAAALERFVPRLFRSPESVVATPQNGWVAVYNEVASREPERLRRLGSELSHVTGGVVLTLGVEADAVVRLIAFERGRLMDEYLSRPEHYGPLPPGDAVALRINPRVLARLTGANMDAIRRAAPPSPDRLPPAAEQLAQLAEVLGIEGVGADAREAAVLEGAVTIVHP